MKWHSQNNCRKNYQKCQKHRWRVHEETVWSIRRNYKRKIFVSTSSARIFKSDYWKILPRNYRLNFKRHWCRNFQRLTEECPKRLLKEFQKNCRNINNQKKCWRTLRKCLKNSQNNLQKNPVTKLLKKCQVSSWRNGPNSFQRN